MNFTDTPIPLIPSTISSLYPIGATVIIPKNQLPLPASLDLNQNMRVRRQVTKYFRYKLLDSWLYNELSNLLGYFVINNDGSVSLIDKLDNYNKNAENMDTLEIIDKKSDYIERYILTEDMCYKLIKKFIKGTGSNWYDLTKIEELIEEFMNKQLTKIIEGIIGK